jgi:hypothetical protein
MKTNLLNNEEQQIMNELDRLPVAEKIKTLEDSLTGETEEIGRRVLRSLVSKLKEA